MAKSVKRKLTPVPFSRVEVDDAFWAPRIEANRGATIPMAYEDSKETGRIDAWKLDWREGREPVPHPFRDSGVAKWIDVHPAVAADAGRVALQRGPLVYCLEAVDNGANLNDLTLPPKAKLGARFERQLLGGVKVITARGRRVDRAAWRRDLYRPVESRTRPATLKAVPYFAWDNRRQGEMLVWIREA